MQFHSLDASYSTLMENAWKLDQSWIRAVPSFVFVFVSFFVCILFSIEKVDLCRTQTNSRICNKLFVRDTCALIAIEYTAINPPEFDMSKLVLLLLSSNGSEIVSGRFSAKTHCILYYINQQTDFRFNIELVSW